MHLREAPIPPGQINPLVPEALKGTFAAFALPDSYGIRQLKALALAGLTHLHLLPVFDQAAQRPAAV